MRASTTMMILLLPLLLMAQEKVKNCNPEALTEIKELLVFEKFEEALHKIKQPYLSGCPRDSVTEKKLTAINGIKKRKIDSIEIQLIEIYIKNDDYENAKVKALALFESEPLLTTKKRCLELIHIIENNLKKNKSFYDSIAFFQAEQHIRSFRYEDGLKQLNKIQTESNKKIAAKRILETESEKFSVYGQVLELFGKYQFQIFVILLIIPLLIIFWLVRKGKNSRKVRIVEDSKTLSGYKSRFEMLFNTMNAKYKNNYYELYVSIPDNSGLLNLRIWNMQNLIQLDSVLKGLKYGEWIRLLLRFFSRPPNTLTYSVEKDESTKRVYFRAIFEKRNKLLFPYEKVSEEYEWFLKEEEMIYDLVHKIHVNLK